MIRFRWTLSETVVEGWESAEVSKAYFVVCSNYREGSVADSLILTVC